MGETVVFEDVLVVPPPEASSILPPTKDALYSSCPVQGLVPFLVLISLLRNLGINLLTRTCHKYIFSQFIIHDKTEAIYRPVVFIPANFRKLQ